MKKIYKFLKGLIFKKKPKLTPLEMRKKQAEYADYMAGIHRRALHQGIMIPEMEDAYISGNFKKNKS